MLNADLLELLDGILNTFTNGICYSNTADDPAVLHDQHGRTALGLIVL